MAKLKSIRKQEAEIEKLQQQTEEANVHLNEDEKKALESDVPVSTNKVSSQKLEKVAALVQEKFNLSSEFYVTGYVDKGNKILVSLSNSDFDITITVKNPLEYELVDL